MGVEARAAFYVSRKPTKTYCFHAPAASERSTPNQNMGVEARAALYVSRKPTKTHGFHDPTASEQFKLNQNTVALQGPPKKIRSKKRLLFGTGFTMKTRTNLEKIQPGGV